MLLSSTLIASILSFAALSQPTTALALPHGIQQLLSLSEMDAAFIAADQASPYIKPKTGVHEESSFPTLVDDTTARMVGAAPSRVKSVDVDSVLFPQAPGSTAQVGSGKDRTRIEKVNKKKKLFIFSDIQVAPYPSYTRTPVPSATAVADVAKVSALSGAPSLATHYGVASYYTSPPRALCDPPSSSSLPSIYLSPLLFTPSLCGRTISATHDGRTMQFSVQGRCKDCLDTWGVEISPAMFTELGDIEVGDGVTEIGLKWKFEKK